MQRDMELVRRILLALEAEGSGPPRNKQVEVEGYDSITIGHHVYLMKQAGLVRAADSSAHGRAATAIPFDLTWAGHDYLNAVRDEGVWQSVKAKAGPRLGSLTFDVVKELAVSIVRGSLGLST